MIISILREVWLIIHLQTNSPPKIINNVLLMGYNRFQKMTKSFNPKNQIKIRMVI